MRLLLDTHALIWFALGDSSRMPKATAELIADPEQEVFISAATIWEIATKSRLGKLTGAEDIAARPGHYISELGMSGLQISVDHAARAGGFPQTHRDPFDRMLAAQAGLEDMQLVSLDGAMDAFGVMRLWPN